VRSVHARNRWTSTATAANRTRMRSHSHLLPRWCSLTVAESGRQPRCLPCQLNDVISDERLASASQAQIRPSVVEPSPEMADQLAPHDSPHGSYGYMANQSNHIQNLTQQQQQMVSRPRHNHISLATERQAAITLTELYGYLAPALKWCSHGSL